MNGEEALDALHKGLTTPGNGDKPKQGNVFPTIVALLLVALIGVWLWMYWRDSAPPATYTSGEWTQGEVCPGQVISWSTTIRVNRAPIVGFAYATVWSVDKGSTPIPDLAPAVFIWDKNGIAAKVRTYTIPQIPAGRYEFRAAMVAVGSSRPSIQKIPFTVKEGCP